MKCPRCKTSCIRDSLFCITCGSTFGRRLCPHLHSNPPDAAYCATCGSPDLYPPKPIRPASSRTIGLAAILIGLLLVVFASLLIIPRLRLPNDETLLVIIAVGIVLFLAMPRHRK